MDFEPLTIIGDDGSELKAVPVDKFEEAIQKAKDAEAELERLREADKDKTDNLYKMRTAKDETETELEKLRREYEESRTAMAAEIETLKSTRINESINDAVATFAGNDETIAQRIRENLELININVTSREDAQLKVEKAAMMAGVSKRSELTANMGGSFPSTAPNADDAEFNKKHDEFKKSVFPELYK